MAGGCEVIDVFLALVLAQFMKFDSLNRNRVSRGSLKTLIVETKSRELRPEAARRWQILTEKERGGRRDGDATETLIPISTQPISHQNRVAQIFISM